MRVGAGLVGGAVTEPGVAAGAETGAETETDAEAGIDLGGGDPSAPRISSRVRTNPATVTTEASTAIVSFAELMIFFLGVGSGSCRPSFGESWFWSLESGI